MTEQSDQTPSAEPSLPPPAIDPASGRIACDLLCVECEYNLRTLAADGRCPECGRPVRDSVLEHDPPGVHFNWLVVLKGGFDLLVWGSPLLGFAVFGGIILNATGGHSVPEILLGSMFAASGVLGGIMTMIGVCVVIGPQPPGSAGRAPRWARPAFFAGILGSMTVIALLVVVPSLPAAFRFALPLCVPLAGSVPIAFGVYCRWLACRSRRDNLRRATTVATWSWVVCVALGAVALMVFFIDDSGRIRWGDELGSSLLVAMTIIFVGGLPLWIVVFFMLRKEVMSELDRFS